MFYIYYYELHFFTPSTTVHQDYASLLPITQHGGVIENVYFYVLIRTFPRSILLIVLRDANVTRRLDIYRNPTFW